MCQCPARYARNGKLVSQKNRRQRTMHVTSYKQMCPTLGFATKARLEPTETKMKKKILTFHKDDKVSATTVFDSTKIKLDYTARFVRSQHINPEVSCSSQTGAHQQNTRDQSQHTRDQS